jgi:hypothetical protein
VRYSLFRGPRVIYRGGFVRRLVAVGALGAITVGALSYYPVAYAAVPQPVCGGVTDNGCALQWADVPTEEGVPEPQCVQYCPRGVEPVAVAVAAAPPEPIAAAQGNCELVGFSDPQFAGDNFQTNDSYPALEQWSRQIASIQVNAGTWDLYSDENYGGDVIRLDPGQYPDLGEQWAYQISSFMCTVPGS